MANAPKPSWTFKSRFRSNAYGWRASRLACQRIGEAVVEIKAVSRRDAVHAADGAVALLERLWPSLQSVDSSSGALGSAVYRAQQELLPLVITAPATAKIRQQWLERLWTAVQEDGVNYLWPVEERWGELCGSQEVASLWADRFLAAVREVWADDHSSPYLRGSCLCCSSLLAAGRHEELWELLALARYPSWSYRQFGARALVKEGRVEEALAYAEASRGLNQPDAEIDAACERMLLEAGRSGEAYARYGLRCGLAAAQASTGVSVFRALRRKYPEREPRHILVDLAEQSGDPGRWFASAKDAGFLDLALRFAERGHTDPRTLSRAARDFLDRDPAFALAVGRLAVERMLQGEGYEITAAEVLSTYEHAMAAASKLQVEPPARADFLALATPGNAGYAPAGVKAFQELVRRRASVGDGAVDGESQTDGDLGPESSTSQVGGSHELSSSKISRS